MKKLIILTMILAGIHVQLFADNKTIEEPFSVYVSASYMPSVGYRAVRIGVPQLEDRDALIKRRFSETSIYNWNAKVQLGATVLQRYTFFAEGFRMMQGFVTNGTGINWHKGFHDTSGVQQYNFLSYGAGIGFGYNSYSSAHKKPVNFLMEAGCYYVINLNYQEQCANGDVREISAKEEQIKQGIRNPNAFGYHLGMGIGIRPFAGKGKSTYRHELKIMPTLNYNLTRLNRFSDLQTSLYSIGITLGYSLRLF